jgi:hypothetical protein
MPKTNATAVKIQVVTLPNLGHSERSKILERRPGLDVNAFLCAMDCVWPVAA